MSGHPPDLLVRMLELAESAEQQAAAIEPPRATRLQRALADATVTELERLLSDIERTPAPRTPEELRSMKLTTVECVHRQEPNAWQSLPDHVYVGRRVPIRSGRYGGQLWRPSVFANHFKLPEDPTLQDRRELIVRFETYLANRPDLLSHLHTLAGKTLGCWCGSWDGQSQPRLLCHAAVLADWCNHLSERPWEKFIAPKAEA